MAHGRGATINGTERQRARSAYRAGQRLYCRNKRRKFVGRLEAR